jgi:hypothetical protein
MVNTRRTGSACQAIMASSVASNPWILSIAGITCVSSLGHVNSRVNHEDVSHNCFMYLYFVSPFFYCLLNSFLLHQYPNYRVECDYPFTKDMQNGGVDNVISDICMFLHREVFHGDGTFFDKTGTLAEFPKLYNYQ